jgi:hypothetical protein
MSLMPLPRIRSIAFRLILTLFLPLAVSQASVESQRYLRNALHFYHVGAYERSKAYFIALLSIGSAKEQKLATSYLKRPELQRILSASRSKKVLTPHERYQSYLQSGITLYKTGNFQDSIKYFSTVATSGDSRQQVVAKSYLDMPALRDLTVLGGEPEAEPETPEPTESAPHISGYAKEEAAFRLSLPRQLTKLRTLGYLGVTGPLAEDISYRVSGRLFYDGVYDLTDHYPRPVEDDQKTEATLRDAYIDLSKGNWDLRAGKQQIVWGEAIGLFYADVVNAKDLREFVLPDFEFIRIPDWATDLEYTLGNFHAEAIWLPWPEMDKIARPGAEFAAPLPVIPGFTVAFNPEEDPARSLENSEAGGRLSYRAGTWDLGVFYLRTWDKEPVYTRTVQPGLITFQPTHPRLTVEGATFATELEDVVLKGEFVYNNQKQFAVTDIESPTGVVSKDYIDYLFGVDHIFPYKVDVSAQLSQRIIRDYESDIFLEKAFRTYAALSIRRPFLNDRVEPSFVMIQDLSAGDYMMRPRLGYKWASNWRVAVGLDLFGGSSDTPFGVYSGHDRIYSEIRFDF